MKISKYKNILSFVAIALIISPISTDVAFAISQEGIDAAKAAGTNTGAGLLQDVQQNGFGGNNTSSSGNSGGGVAGSAASGCATNLISGAAISATILLLTGVERITNVPVSGGANNIGQAFDSGKNFTDFLKENCLDPAARAIYKKMLLQTEQSIFNWANNGFKGGPLDGATFPQDLESYFGSIKDTATSAWISDQDRNNPFYNDIVNAVYQKERNTNNGYTPDLAETILAAECASYQQNQRQAALGGLNQSSSGGIFGAIGSLFDSIFGGQNGFRTNNGGYQNGGSQNNGAIYNFGSPSGFDFKTSKVYDFDYNSAINATNTSNTLLQDYAASTQTNPCGRTFANAEEKNAYIQSYNNGRVNVSSQYKWDILSRSFECQNRRDCVVLTALNSQENAAATAQNTENTNLQVNNGNTGTRVCVAWIPQTSDERAADTERQCRQRRTTTPGSLVASQVAFALQTPIENVNKLTNNATFADVAQAVLNNLINGLTNQLINSVDGIFSFNSNKTSTSGSSAGNFTSGVANLNNTSSSGNATSVSDIDSSISKTQVYIGILDQNHDTLAELVSTVKDIQSVCSQVLSSGNQYSGFGGLLSGINQNPNYTSCQIDPYSLDYKNDPTVGAKLAQNPIYIEVTQLDNTISTRDSVLTSLQNAQSTLSALKQAKTTYQNSTDPNRDSNFAMTSGYLLSGVPQDDSINVAQSQSTTLTERLNKMKGILETLRSSLNQNTN